MLNFISKYLRRNAYSEIIGNYPTKFCEPFIIAAELLFDIHKHEFKLFLLILRRFINRGNLVLDGL